MLRDITIGQYLARDTAVHRLDPRTKIIATIVFMVVLFLVPHLAGYAFLGIFAAVVVILAGIPPRMLLRSIRSLAFILGLTFFLQLFMTRGEPLFALGPLVATREGFTMGAFMISRLTLLIVMTSLLTLTTSPIALTDGLEYLLRPFRRVGLPAHELAMMMTIALRFIPTLLEEADKIMKAQMARGADFRSGNLLRRARSLIPLLVPLFVSAFRRADELALAMEARCYRGGEGRTRMKQLAFAPRDGIAFTTVAAMFLGVLLLRVWS
ncbi:MAG TPA: energy-coupling factor transporter transmembrane component T [Bacillota bacterium]|nr:energy-coupling factor transporter transmembrane component T [Bacillota bacterium]